ncbi:MAG: aldehyde dehydrogenase family protein [Deltaproteobacteria bacterium]|nr:aldehyde dehydrogenase family protein [Deltaproteobacteria bacterium]
MTDFFREERLLIDGELVQASGGATYENINPATEEVIGVAADAGSEDIDRAIAAARRAFDDTDWARDHSLRARCLRQLHDAFQENLDALRESYIAEVGCPINMTYGPGIDAPVESLKYYADFLEKFEWTEELGTAAPLGAGEARRWLEREAVGVVAAITAWNFPHELNLKKVGWALAAGCTVVLKGAPATPWCTLLLGKFFHENTDIPAGVINTITSSQNGIGEQLTKDPRVDMVSFTGSTATGKRILEVTAPFIKRVALELGGKSALILMDDLPGIPDIAGQAGASVCMHSGQGCAMLSRILVPKSQLDESAQKLAAAMANVKVGDPNDPETVQGPQCSADQRDRVLALIEEGIEDGARLLCGGGRPKDQPSVVAQQEFFGPVQCLIGYDDEEDAIRIANNSSYGLSGGILCADIERARRVARRIRTGTMMINGGMWYGPDVPFGGYKNSGLGRENGAAGFEEFLEIKALAEPVG